MNELLTAEYWQDFHFLRPQFLWGIAVVLIIYFIQFFALKEKVKWQKYIAPHLRAYMIERGSIQLKYWIQALFVIGLSFGFVAASGPTWQKEEVEGRTLETPMVVVVDLSQSMLASDIQPNRLERSKFKLKDLLEANPGARIALIGFAGSAHTIIPLTRDYKIINSHVESLSPKIMPFKGSDLNDALLLADSMVRSTEAPGTIVVFTDELREHHFQMIQSQIRDTEHQIVIFPMATEMGAEVPSYSGRGSMKKNGEAVVSKIDGSMKEKLASLDGVEVVQLTLDKSDVETLALKISRNLKFQESEEEKEDEWEDRGWYLIWPFALIFLFWFRKGWVLFSMSALLLLSSCSSEGEFKDLWITKDYQAQQLEDQGNYAEAAQMYEDPLRKGIAFYKSGDYESAIIAFGKDTTAMGAYNLGLSYYANGEYEFAKVAFERAVELDPSMEGAMSNVSKIDEFVMLAGIDEADPSEATVLDNPEMADNIQNMNSEEDLGGGGQEATEEDMEKERLEETVATDISMANELDEVPEDFESGSAGPNSKVLMRKTDDDPAVFLKKKFEYEVKRKAINKSNEDPW